MLCAQCGTENIEQAEHCIKCGAPLKLDAASPYPRITNLDMQFDAPADGKPVVSSVLNLAVIAGSLFFPIIGIIMGFTYLRKTDPAARKAGKIWLVFGMVFLLMQIVLVSLR
ncbi:MAG: hypothetical protein KF908_07245 [Nitrosomonas sp.]|nr:hypothetical protein [Nitrosomonas sp.]MBX3639633.1 hypothetical protein [Nitrosomonas sp.]MCW5606981.1 hypothetical protein [Nitrosomonas sp.]